MKNMQNLNQIPIEKLFDDLNGLSLDETNRYIDDAISADPENVPIVVEIIYFLLDFLLYARYKDDTERDVCLTTLLRVFDNSRRLDGNAEYLCYVGYLIALAFWAFGQSDLSLSRTMLRQAKELEPSNRLYEWAYLFSTSQPGWAEIANELLRDEVFVASMTGSSQAKRYLLEMIRESVSQC